MARYIEADKLCENLKDMASVQPPFKQSTILGVVETIKNTPTADVIPKEFLTRKEDEAYARGYAEAKTEVAREIFEEIERLMENNEVYFRQTDEMQEEFAELKKKYEEPKV